jgi:hypothetical protein
VQVFVRQGKPAPAPAAAPTPAPAPASAQAQQAQPHDNFNDLLALGRQFDNIEIKE